MSCCGLSLSLWQAFSALTFRLISRMALSTSSRARSLLSTALSLLSASFFLWLACSRILAQSPSMPVGSCGPWSLGAWHCPAWPWPPFSSSSLCMLFRCFHRAVVPTLTPGLRPTCPPYRRQVVYGLGWCPAQAGARGKYSQASENQVPLLWGIGVGVVPAKGPTGPPVSLISSSFTSKSPFAFILVPSPSSSSRLVLSLLYSFPFQKSLRLKVYLARDCGDLGICNNGQRPATPGWCFLSASLESKGASLESKGASEPSKMARRPSCTFPPWPGYILIPPWLAQKTKQISATNTKLLSELSVLYINQQHGCFWILNILGFSLDSPPGCFRCFCAPGDRSNAFWKQEEKPQGSGCSGAPGLGPHWVSLSVGRSEA